MSSQYMKPPLQPLQYARNGKYPDAAYQAQMAELANHIAMFRMKEAVSFGMTTGVIASAPDSSDRLRWRGRYTASPYVRAVAVRALLAQSEQTLGEFETEQPAHCLIEFTNQSANMVAAADLYYGNAVTEAANPDDCGVLDAWVMWDPADAPVGETIWTPTAGALYDILVTDVQSRIVALSIYEISLTYEEPFTEGYAVKTPILDTDRSELLNAARLMWKQQAAPLFTWCVDDETAPRVTSTGTPTNIVDNTSTTITAAKPGFTLDTRFRDRVSTSTVSVRMHAYASVEADEAAVHLYDSGGSIVGSVPITSLTPAWHSATFEMPAALAKYDLHYQAVTGEDLTVWSVVLEQYASGT